MSNNINKRFSVCNIIKKSEAIELLKNNLTLEELKALLQPNYNHLIKMLKLYPKKDIQYLLYNTTKIGMDKIGEIIRKNAITNTSDSEQETENEPIQTNADLLYKSIKKTNHYEANFIEEIPPIIVKKISEEIPPIIQEIPPIIVKKNIKEEQQTPLIVVREIIKTPPIIQEKPPIIVKKNIEE